MTPPVSRTRTLWRSAVVAGLAVASTMAGMAPVLAGETASPGPFDPVSGYRIERYRAPVDMPPQGGSLIGLDDLIALMAKEKPVLIDVLPAEGGRPDPETGVWQLAQPHKSIPGAHWLPEVGRGKPAAWAEAHLKRRLAALTGGDMSAPVVVFCQSDCWMSWNVTKRAASYGYTRLYLYSDGTDGWRDFDRDLVETTPDPVDKDLLGER